MASDIIHKGRDNRKHDEEIESVTETEPIVWTGNVVCFQEFSR